MSRYAARFAVPVVAVSLLAVGGSVASAATSAPAAPGAPAAGSKRFCTESTTLVKDLLHFGTLPKTTAAISAALSKVDREFAQLAKDAPSRADRATITSMRGEFAKLKMIVVTDPNATKPADLAFVKAFSKTSAKQGGVLGGEIKAACR